MAGWDQQAWGSGGWSPEAWEYSQASPGGAWTADGGAWAAWTGKGMPTHHPTAAEYSAAGKMGRGKGKAPRPPLGKGKAPPPPPTLTPGYDAGYTAGWRDAEQATWGNAYQMGFSAGMQKGRWHCHKGGQQGKAAAQEEEAGGDCPSGDGDDGTGSSGKRKEKSTEEYAKRQEAYQTKSPAGTSRYPRFQC